MDFTTELESLIEKTHSTSPRTTDAQRRLAEMCRRMAAELAQRHMENDARHHLASIVENADLAIISKSLDGVIQSWNPGAERLFGYTSSEVLQRSITLLLPEGAEREEITIQGKLRRGERVRNYDTLRRHKDSRLIPVSLTISPVRDEAGRILGATQIARDMAGQREREAQAALIEQLKSALAEVKALRGFIPICAHCKKIRDDAGYWQGLEQYLGRHSTARFSHGVCPGCMDKHYGEMMNSQLI